MQETTERRGFPAPSLSAWQGWPEALPTPLRDVSAALGLFEVGSSCLHPPGDWSCSQETTLKDQQQKRVLTQISEKLKGKDKTLRALLGGGES